MTSLIPISEIFGPTYQGEGSDIGRPVMFVRLHHCPVHCPGCDTHYTWDGSEIPSQLLAADILFQQVEILQNQFHRLNIVLSGGEPLIYYQHEQLLAFLKQAYLITSLTLETNGYFSSEIANIADLTNFLRYFKMVHLSPKITPSFHGRYSDERLIINLQPILSVINQFPKTELIFKFVAKDMNDLETVYKFDQRHNLTHHGYQIYIMPFGTSYEQIKTSADNLLPELARLGYWLTPRLHVLLWNNQRKT